MPSEKDKTLPNKIVQMYLQIKSMPTTVKLGVSLIVLCAVVFLANLYPIIVHETRYYFRTWSEGASQGTNNVSEELDSDTLENNVAKNAQDISVGTTKSVSKDFGILIPKININAPIIAEVDPADPEIYQKALTKGVAHAKGASYPDRIGNLFLFAHSSDSFFNANRYNSVFYLVHHLSDGDPIHIYYKDDMYTYTVFDKQVVSPYRVEFMSQDTDEDKILTLMTCWPPGTTAKRMIIRAIQSN